MEDLASLSVLELHSIKRLLEKFFYTAGTNIALYNTWKKPESKLFKKNTKLAIEKQILHIAELDRVLHKQEYEFKEDWLAFEKAYDGGKEKILLFLLFALVAGEQSALDKLEKEKKLLSSQFLDNNAKERFTFLTETLDRTGMEWVAKTIQAGTAGGLSNTEIVKALREQAGEVSNWRAEMITETELMYNMNLTEVEVYKLSGIKRIRWSVVEDEKTCSFCLANEAAGEIKLGEEFPSGSTHPPQHSRCRCYLLPVI